MDIKPFKFNKTKRENFCVPDFFLDYNRPDEKTLEYWKWQYQLAKEGKKHQLPQDRLRMTSNRLHQIGAKMFYKDVPKDFSTILDVGCSDGYMVKHFQDDGKVAQGIDSIIYPTDKLFIEKHDLNIKEMDMHNLDFENGCFDAVWSRHTLEHSFAPLRVLAEINRVLNTGGYLFLALPPPPDPPKPYPGHWHQIPKYQLNYLIQMYNFEILKLEISYFTYERENDNLEIRCICKKK